MTDFFLFQDEFVTSLAAMALYDGDAEISAAQLEALITATGNSVEPYWPSLFSSMLGPDIADVIFTRGGNFTAAAGQGGATEEAATNAPAAKEEKPKVEEVDALAGGMDMFGGDGGDY